MRESEEEFKKKEEELLAKFSVDFPEKIRKQHFAGKVFHALLHDYNIYEIIENLLDVNNGMFDMLQRKISLDPPPPITVTKERFEEIKKGEWFK